MNCLDSELSLGRVIYNSVNSGLDNSGSIFGGYFPGVCVGGGGRRRVKGEEGSRRRFSVSGPKELVISVTEKYFAID